MLDFTSAQHLGLAHASADLDSWSALASGRPPALGEVPGAAEAATGVAELVGTARAALFPSTLHLFVDVFAELAERGGALLYDETLYPVVRWQVDCARGFVKQSFRHQDVNDLRRRMQQYPDRHRPVVVTDGLCTGCGRSAPLGAYLTELRQRGGTLVVDDTQAIGVLGRPVRGLPFGRGGGGSLRFWREAGDDVLWGASLAKAFGAPVAVLAGDQSVVDRIAHEGPTRWHCSGVSAAAVAALRRALAINAQHGDLLRLRLARLCERLGRGLRALGLAAFSAPLPFQATVPLDLQTARAVQRRLAAAGVRCLLQRPRCRDGVAVIFLITTAHERRDITRVLDVFGDLRAPLRQTQRIVATGLF